MLCRIMSWITFVKIKVIGPLIFIFKNEFIMQKNMRASDMSLKWWMQENASASVMRVTFVRVLAIIVRAFCCLSCCNFIDSVKWVQFLFLFSSLFIFSNDFFLILAWVFVAIQLNNYVWQLALTNVPQRSHTKREKFLKTLITIY